MEIEETKPADSNATMKLLASLRSIANGFGEYAECAFQEDDPEKKEKKGREMLLVLANAEDKCETLNEAELWYSLAIAYQNYCAWFVRGERRKQVLEKCVIYLDKALTIEPYRTDAASALGSLLIEENLVRDLSRGIELLERLKSNDEMPIYLNSVLAKAHRQSGDIAVEQQYDLCRFKDPSPAVFREERKRFRALIRKYKKQGDIDCLKIALRNYYNLAILVTVCYGDYDCNIGVLGEQYDKAITTVKRLCKKIDYSYELNGVLENSSFISPNDWKTFVKVFGENSKKFDPTEELQRQR